MARSSDKSSKELVALGAELRLLDRRAFVGFPELVVLPGMSITDFALQIPEVAFPFNVSGGAARYQNKKLDFGFLEVAIDAELIARQVAALSGKLPELDELRLHFRPGYLEGQARLRNSDRAAVTFKVAFDGDGERLAVYLYDVRLYAFAPVPAAHLPVLLTHALAELELLPHIEPRGATGFTTRVLPPLVQLASVGRGFKMPALDQARLSAAEVSGRGLRLRFSAGGLPPPAAPDEELLLALEGARAFSDAEALLAQGKLKEAQEAYLKAGDVQDAHPFAAERLLNLLVADPQTHELALDVAQTLARRREKSATALWAEAVVRERRGESARAAERFLALCALSRKNQEEAAAFFAAESAARASRDHAPQMAVRALHELLGLRPDHLPSLKALARASDQAQDRAGAIRAYRRIAALAREPSEAADAHVHMAQLCALTEDDVAGARLHCEAALRLAPDHPDALMLLGELCHRAGESLRAIKALDRLREVAMGRHEVDRIGRANMLAGLVWETGLQQPENALLRYREAVSLLPGEPEPLFLSARVAEALGKLQEALAGYQQAVELAGPAPRTEEIRHAAHQAHHALARLYRTRLGDPARAKEHLEAALALDPRDLAALDELIPFFRASGRIAELAEACEKAAAVVEEPLRRAALWAEAGELQRSRLGSPEKAERLLDSALEVDPRNRMALEGMLALAESRRDGGQLCRCLKALSDLVSEEKDRVRYLRRLAVAARDLAFDLDLAVHAFSEVLKFEPDDLPSWSELCGLQRRRGDSNGLATALEQRARVAEAHGDKRLATAALRELAQVLEVRLGRTGEALVALEKAARLHPDPAVLLDLANLSLRCERPQNARRALEELLLTLPKHSGPERLAEVRAKLGRACELLGDKDSARENYAQAFPARRLDDELFLRLESLYDDAGLSRELTELWGARAQALVAAARANEAAPLFFKSAQHLLKVGDHSAAILRFSAALEAAPDGEHAGQTLEAMAELEISRGELQEAAKLLARRAGQLPDGREAARVLFRAAGLVQGSRREAGLLAQAVERDPTFCPARVRRADLALMSDPRAALADLEAVLAADPADPDLPDEGIRLELVRRAAFVALRARLLDIARRHLAYFVAHRPEDMEAVQELASLHRQAGATEALCDLLGELWPRLTGAAQKAARQEFAELTLALGRTASAMEVLREVLRADPADGWAARRLFDLLPDENPTPAERIEQLELLSLLARTADGEQKAEWLTRRAQRYLADQRLLEARDDLSEAGELSPRPAGVYRQLAEVCHTLQDAPAELYAWRQALKHEPSYSELASSRLFALGSALVSSGQLAVAREAYETLSALPLTAAQRCEAFIGLAGVAQAQGEVAAAIGAFQEASAQGPAQKRCEALLRRAELLEHSGQPAEAAQSYEAALALAPRHLGATEGLKRTLTEMEDWSALAEVLASEATYAPRTTAAGLFAQLGELYLERLQQADKAEAAFRRTVTLDKTHAPARRRLASLLAARGELHEACAMVEEAAGLLDSAPAAELLREGSRLARQAGELDLSLRLARKAQQLSPARGEVLGELADLLYLRGAVKETLPILEQLASQVSFAEDPQRAETVLLRLADLAEQEGQLQLAESTLRKVVDSRPLHGAAVERLAALIHPRSPREAIGVQVRYLMGLSASERTVTQLLAMAERVQVELADVELTARLVTRAAELSEAPLPIHRRLVQLYREAGRTAELMGELLQLAHLLVEEGDVDGAIAAYAEEAALAETSGRVDEALKTFQAIVELCEDEGRVEEASKFECRRASLFTDAKLDLESAQEALARAFQLFPSAQTARLGRELALRRDDREAEMDWLERLVDVQQEPADRAQALTQLARMHLGLASTDESNRLEGATQMAPDQAEAALKEALRAHPQATSAEALLQTLFERSGRQVDLASHYEEQALRTEHAEDRARLLVRAAGIYQEKAGKPHAAAAALMAARAALPDDASLTRRLADLLQQLGRAPEAAEFDALLLETDPFDAVFERHQAFLREGREYQSLAALLLGRAERQQGEEAAVSFLSAAECFHHAGAAEQARLCEEQAFRASPTNARAFDALCKQAEGDIRREAELYRARAEAVPQEAARLLGQSAERLIKAGEVLLAAQTLDDLLAVAPNDVAALERRAELAHQSGGPQAAQVYDRRLLSAGGEQLAVPLQVKTRLRLGHASLDSGAYQDAADALSVVVRLDPQGERGKEALSLLSEVYSRTQNTHGLYQTSLMLAERVKSDEAEALYRRAANLFDAPSEAIDALVPLAQLRPADSHVVDRAVEGLQALGRHDELVELCQRHAEATGGVGAAERLLRAAQVAQESLQDPHKARELREAAGRMDPQNLTYLRWAADEYRRNEQRQSLIPVLSKLVELADDADEQSLLRLELAQALIPEDPRLARAHLDRLLERGPSGAGYAAALEQLEPLLTELDEPLALAQVQAARAELSTGETRADQLFQAAQTFQRAGDVAEAIRVLRQSLVSRADSDRLVFLADLHEGLEQYGEMADALVRAAQSGSEQSRPALMLRVVEARERAGDPAEARVWLERLISEAPEALSPAQRAEWFARLGDSHLATRLLFDAALAEGRLDEALSVAEQAQDPERIQQALWALARSAPDAQRIAQLAGLLRKDGDEEGVMQLAELCHRAGRDEQAVQLLSEQVAHASPERLPGLARTLSGWGGVDTLMAVVARRPELAEHVLPVVQALPEEQREQHLAQLAQVIPNRRGGILRELFELRRSGQRWTEAAQTLTELIASEEDRAARSALHAELGELYVHQLGDRGRAREAFELALAEDAQAILPIRHLLDLYSPHTEPDLFLAMVERMEQLAGPESVGAHREALALAYEGLGRTREAYELLAQLPETPELLARRATHADALGLTGEALQLREKYVEDPEELEQVLRGYLMLDLVPFAVRLARPLLETGQLSFETQRLLAERLAPTAQGAEIAVEVWVDLLRTRPADADGWTLFAEALRHLGRPEQAQLVDGFGAALTSGRQSAPAPKMGVVPLSLEGLPASKDSLLPISEETMPRLAALLGEVLRAMGLEALQPMLDSEGGAEAYLAAPNKLVVGAGALSCFGPTELTYLVALAARLGAQGHQLTEAAVMPGLEQAAVEAFNAYPASLAASRVLGILDDRVRGADPFRYELGELLPQNRAFLAIAMRALDLIVV